MGKFFLWTEPTELENSRVEMSIFGFLVLREDSPEKGKSWFKINQLSNVFGKSHASNFEFLNVNAKNAWYEN